MEQTLDHTASRDDIAEALKESYGHTDSDVTDEDIDAVHTAHMSHLSWRQSLSMDERIALMGTPITSIPDTSNHTEGEEF